MWDEIWKDVRRTRTEIGFFKLPLDPNKKLSMQDMKLLETQFTMPIIEYTTEMLDDYIYTHSDILARILFVYAKLNAGLKYVQGMNEVLSVLYYCFWLGGSFMPPSIKEEQESKKDQSESGKFQVDSLELKHLEADLFSAFSSMMVELRDCFLRELDKESTGI